ncbi:hypothetical protein FRC20_007259, partial [Serendipita sp. 405]
CGRVERKRRWRDERRRGDTRKLRRERVTLLQRNERTRCSWMRRWGARIACPVPRSRRRAHVRMKRDH